MSFFTKQIDKRLAQYQRELVNTHYREVDNMDRQIRGWRLTSSPSFYRHRWTITHGNRFFLPGSL